jgi:hypothetical protein
MAERRSFSVGFLATMALLALRGDKTAQENPIRPVI